MERWNPFPLGRGDVGAVSRDEGFCRWSKERGQDAEDRNGADL
jgi:hypothetical protein